MDVAVKRGARDLWSLARRLADAELTAGDLLTDCLARIDDPAGEGGRTFLSVSRDTARATAESIDARRAAGVPVPPLAGIPLSIKDLFDVQGEPTRAGSLALADAPPAGADAPCITRLRRAGAVFVGRTNMTEFAYSGVGINPHFDTPRNAWGRDVGRIPGGSSSGAAVSVTDGMAAAGIGTDTGGSCRIPAALSGLAGFKPSARRIPLDGVVPLSPSYDSVGSLAPTVACVALLDAVMAGQEPVQPPDPLPLAGLRLLLVKDLFLDDVDDVVGRAFDGALEKLAAAGVRIDQKRVASMALIPDLARQGGIVAAEAYAWHRALVERRGADYDPRVRARILAGAEQSAADFMNLQETRRRFRDDFERETGFWDAVVAPTVPIQAPPLAAFEADEEFARLNRLLLRNPSVANMLDACSITLPCHAPGEPPVGLMLIGRNGTDRRLLAMARALEQNLQGTKGR